MNREFAILLLACTTFFSTYSEAATFKYTSTIDLDVHAVRGGVNAPFELTWTIDENAPVEISGVHPAGGSYAVYRGVMGSAVVGENLITFRNGGLLIYDNWWGGMYDRYALALGDDTGTQHLTGSLTTYSIDAFDVILDFDDLNTINGTGIVTSIDVLRSFSYAAVNISHWDDAPPYIYVSTNSDTRATTLSDATTPLPGAAWLFATGLGMLAVIRRRQNSRP